jgi:cell division protein FtsB
VEANDRNVPLQDERPRRRKFWWILTIVAFVLAAVMGSGTALVYRAMQHQPDFYERALAVNPQKQAAAGDELERQVLELHNEVRRPGIWQAKFTDEQINGWLAADLVEKFPKLLPKEVLDPRVDLEPERVRVACRYEAPTVTSVVSLDVEVYLTQEPNVVAVRIYRARAGVLPLPLKHFLDRITQIAAQSGLHLRWAQEDGDPVALFTIPAEHEDYATQGIYLERLELKDGEVLLAGRSGIPPTSQVASSRRWSSKVQH